MTSHSYRSTKAHFSRRSNADPVGDAVAGMVDGPEPSDGELAAIAAQECDWRGSALCAEVDPELWFPEKGVPGEAAHGRAAKKICAACPVQAQCLEYALSLSGVVRLQGIWAGTNEPARLRIVAAGAADAAIEAARARQDALTAPAHLAA